MEKVVNYILNVVPVECKIDSKKGSRFIQNETTRIINLFDDKMQLIFKKGTVGDTINSVTFDSRIQHYDKEFANLLLAHMVLYFNSSLLAKDEELPLSDYFKHLLQHQTYGMDRDTIKKYL